MRVLWLTGIVILLDQATKLLVMRTMYLGQQIPLLGDWLKLTYTENPGMAFGITFGPRGMVTVFSVIATFLIILYLFKVRKGYLPYRASLAFILGGAVGNIIDRVFYGAIFNGDSLFVGRVVDFIHVNVWSGFIPESLPLIGGTYLSLFPIWNVADMAIVCGVVGILYFQKRFHYGEYYDSLGESAAGLQVESETTAVGMDGSNDRVGVEEGGSPSSEYAGGGTSRRPAAAEALGPPKDAYASTEDFTGSPANPDDEKASGTDEVAEPESASSEEMEELTPERTARGAGIDKSAPGS